MTVTIKVNYQTTFQNKEAKNWLFVNCSGLKKS